MASGASRATVAAGYARALMEFAMSLGADEARLRAAAGLTPADLDNLDARISLERFIALMRAGKAETGNPALALEFGAATDLRHFSIVGLIAHASATMAEALVQLNRYGRLVMDVDGIGEGERFEIIYVKGERWMIDRRANPNEFPELTEATWSRFVCWTRREFPHATYALAAEVTHQAPAYHAAYERLWQIPVRFSAARNAIQTTVDWDDTPVAPDHRYAFGVLIKHADDLLDELARRTTLRGRVEALLLPLLHTGAASIGEIASKLQTSRQTIYRGLRAEGTTFAEVLDGLRRRMAMHYLEGQRVTVLETAYLVGFADASSFSRAFKRWTGRRPSTARTSKP